VSSIINEMYGPDQLKHARSRTKIRLGHSADFATARLVRRFHAITFNVATVMAARLKLGERPVDVIYRGRDANAFRRIDSSHRSAIRASLGFDDDDLIVLAVGRHEPQKGLTDLVTAFRMVATAESRACLMIAGREGNDTQTIRRLIHQSDLSSRARLLGHRDDINDLLNAADVFAFPSHWEGLGGAVVEALAVGVPIVCSDIPVLREVTTDSSGRTLAVLVRPGDPNSLAAALIAAVSKDGGDVMRPDYARRHFLTQFELGRVASSFSSFYERSLSDKGGAIGDA
jgi:glycosyltransferase involved in cell wall biosynthesis